jgi:tripartite-type tricarboxylate transporter receptor subunit TctC
VFAKNLKPFFAAGPLAIALAAALVLGMMAAPAEAAFPEKPITIIVPFKAGGSTDAMCRVFAKGLGEEVGQPVVVQNRPGAGGAVGGMYIKSVPADGYTILIGHEQIPTWSPIHDKVAFSPDDFTYLGAITEYQQAMICSPDKPYKTLAELIEYSKKNPGLTFADQSTISKLLFLYVAKKEGLDWRAVPTKGGGGMIPMLLGGQVDFAWSGGVHQRYGDKIRVLASCNPNRLPVSPEAPALMEKYGVTQPSLVIVMAPKGLPADIAAYLEGAIKKATKFPPFVSMLKDKLKFPLLFKTGEEVKNALPGVIDKLKAMKAKMGM